MTLVLPAAAYCSNQTAKSHIFTSISSTNSSNMPCVFDGEPLDFESALMTDWPTLKDITEYDAASDEPSKTTPGVNNDKSQVKRKLSSDCGDNVSSPSEPKKLCLQEASPISPIVTTRCSSPLSSSSLNRQRSSHGASSDSADEQQSTSPTSTEGDDEEEMFLPRRRVPQMWNSRQRWKDERKKVLKMSIGKLAEIEDPELWLLRSVLINNTIKRLHQDIRLERQAKIRHRQQRIDFYTERFETAPSVLPPVLHHHHHHHHHRAATPLSTSPTTANYHQPSYYSSVDEKKPQMDTNSSDLYDDTSCDEIFDISEDFLRVTIPDRRVSSPIPTAVQQDCGNATGNSSSSENKNCSRTSDMEVSTPSCFQPTSSGSHCDTSVNSSRDSFPTSAFKRNSSDLATVETSNSRHVGAIISSLPASGGSPCATQYRTNNHDGGGGNGTIGGDSVFPPRVPILDSVVYHSLLASLESS